MPSNQNKDFLEFWHDTCPPEKVPARTNPTSVAMKVEKGPGANVEISNEQWAKGLQRTMKEHEKSRRDHLGPGC
jgi:hypothetical protein